MYYIYSNTTFYIIFTVNTMYCIIFTVIPFTEHLLFARHRGQGFTGIISFNFHTDYGKRDSCHPHLTEDQGWERPSDLSKGTEPCPQLSGCPLPRPPRQATWACISEGAGIGLDPTMHSCLFCLQITGPWRSLWIRYGYDPRKHPEAKMYQVLDFRIRCGMKYGNDY